MDRKDREILELKRKTAPLEAALGRAQLMVELQKKVSEILGISFPKDGEGL